MKKILATLLTLCMILTVASVTMAADLSYWMGGDFYYYFANGIENDQWGIPIEGLHPAVGVF
ncbi:MAG: hypothetical protein K6T90_18070, partial [Leptolyngbyaceae cyanobacterium HOT.MB2.61]|nr:hypothetical protein [Leptolyngbyaceae cyanobacterium HOT.MB2.61]